MTPPPTEACRLCATTTALTFEHIPPRSAGNNQPLRAYSLGAVYRQAAGSRERYLSEQRGAGLYTLCAACNTLCSNRGYVAEMAKWTTILGDAVARGAEQLEEREAGAVASFTLGLRNVIPGRLAREIVVQLLAINEPLFGDDHQALRDFVIDEDVLGLPPEIRIFLSAETRPRSLYVPVTPVLLEDGGMIWITEVAHPPIRFGLVIGANPLLRGDVTGFATYPPTTESEVRLTIPVDAELLPEDLISPPQSDAPE